MQKVFANSDEAVADISDVVTLMIGGFGLGKMLEANRIASHIGSYVGETACSQPGNPSRMASNGSVPTASGNCGTWY